MLMVAFLKKLKKISNNSVNTLYSFVSIFVKCWFPVLHVLFYLQTSDELLTSSSNSLLPLSVIID